MFVWSITAVSSAATLSVGPAQTYATINAAIGAASSGDRIEIHPAVYVERVVVDKRLELVGVNGSGSVTLHPAASAPAMEISKDATITGITISADGEQGITVWGFGRHLEVTLQDVVVSGAFGTIGGGVDADDVTLTILDSTFTDNEADWFGGGLSCGQCDLDLQNSVFTSNRAGDGGGGLDHWGGTINIVDNVFHENVAGSFGGGVASNFEGTSGNQIKRNEFTLNAARDGGGLALIVDPTLAGVSWKVRIRNNLLMENNARHEGGGVYVEGRDQYYGGGGADVKVIFRQNDLLGNDANFGAQYFADEDVETAFESNLVAYGGPGGAAVQQPSVQGTRNWNLFFANAGGDAGGALSVADLGADSLFGVDPMLTAYSQNGDPDDDDTSPLPGSPLIDGGDPTKTDHDGTRTDIGWLDY